MVYTLHEGLDKEWWRRITAAMSAVTVTALVPVIGMIMLTHGRGPSSGPSTPIVSSGHSSEPEANTTAVNPETDNTSSSDNDSAPLANDTASTNQARSVTGASTNSTTSQTPPATSDTSPVPPVGGMGGGDTPEVTDPLEPCECDPAPEEEPDDPTNGVNTDADVTGVGDINADVNTESPADSSLEINLNQLN